MSIDPGRLRHAVWLSAGEQTSAAEAERTASLLDVVEEVLPYLLLRRDGFAGSAPVQQALAAARARAPAGARTPRPAAQADAVQLASAQAEVKAALRAAIDHDLDQYERHARVDDALRRLAQLDPRAAEEPHLRIRR